MSTPKNMIRIKQRLSSLLVLFLAAIFLNSSIDSPDTLYTMILVDGSYQEDLSRNDIESLYEFVAEVLLDDIGALPESDDHESDQLLKVHVSDMFSSSVISLTPGIIDLIFVPGFDDHSNMVSSISDIPYPPPQGIIA